MNRNSPPKKQPVPFGTNGQRENLLEDTPAGDNTASYSKGFPPVTMILKAAGGLPPKGQDMNQILFELSDLMRWASTGALNSFDAEFSSAIGGYPSGAIVLSDAGDKIFISVTNNNTDNPNSTNAATWENAADFIGISQSVQQDIDGKLTKDQNGADIPDKAQFRQNVGLVKQASLLDATAGALMINGAHGGVGGNSVVLPDATNLLTYLQDKPSMVVSGNTALVNGAGFAAVYDFKRSSSNYATLIAYPITNVGNIAVRYFENPSWGSWRPQATLDTDQTITGKKIFNRSSEALQIKALADNQSCFIRGQKADDTPHWYIGKGGADFAVAWANQHSTAANSITLRENGNIDIQVLAGKTLNAIIGGVSGRFLSQGHNAESDANGIWKVPGSAGLTPASIGALSVSDLAGIPLPFPGAAAPTGWLKCNGQSFNTTQYPVLASRYPSGVLPDLRAEFIRGADDGRGVDTGRALLSAQAAYTPPIPASGWGKDGAFPTPSHAIPSGRIVVGSGTVEYAEELESLNGAGNDMTVSGDIHPRNIAFNYIVRAA